MDPIISNYPHKTLSEDLFITLGHGIAFQKDMSSSVSYDQEYYNKYVSYEPTAIADRLNRCRREMIEDRSHCLLDIGIGSGQFIKSCGKRAYGFDINEIAIEWLSSQNLFIDPYEGIPDVIDTITLWDTLEHLRRPSDLLTIPRPGTYVCISMPIFQNLNSVRKSKHYRPNEHYHYFTEAGLKKFMTDLGYKHLETNDKETRAGRESILSFVFIREKALSVADVLKTMVKVVPAPPLVEKNNEPMIRHTIVVPSKN